MRSARDGDRGGFVHPRPQRIGLSATQRPLEEVARYLGGDRPVRIRNMDVQVEGTQQGALGFGEVIGMRFDLAGGELRGQVQRTASGVRSRVTCVNVRSGTSDPLAERTCTRSRSSGVSRASGRTSSTNCEIPGTLRGSSFSFDVAPDGVEWAQTEQGFPLRRLRSIAALYDVGPVTFPAYLATEDDELAVSLRSLSVSTDRKSVV